MFFTSWVWVRSEWFYWLCMVSSHDLLAQDHMYDFTLPWHVRAERIRTPNTSFGVSDKQSVSSSPSRNILVSLSKTLNHYCCVYRMGREAVGPIRSLMHVKEPSALSVTKEKGFAPVFLAWSAAYCTRSQTNKKKKLSHIQLLQTMWHTNTEHKKCPGKK